MRNVLNLMALLCFITAGGILYAYVYDVEPINLAREYHLEKEIFDRSNDNWAAQFPEFADWLDENTTREERLHEWLNAVAQDVGVQFADIWQPGAYERYMRDAENSPSPEASFFERGDPR